MLKLNEVLNQIDNILFKITDESGKVVYPKNSDIDVFNEILKKKKDSDIIYYKKKCFQYLKKEIKKSRKTYILEQLNDITNLRKLQLSLKKDLLTNLLNRYTTFILLDEILVEKTTSSISIVMADIDFFKTLNDEYGHVAGDLVLKTIGELFLKETNANDIVGRYGGEEFLFIYTNNTLENVVEKIENIRKKIKKISLKYNDQKIRKITMSFGIYHVNNVQELCIDNTNVEEERKELINFADMALYKSKKLGRDKTFLYESNQFVSIEKKEK